MPADRRSWRGAIALAALLAAPRAVDAAATADSIRYAVATHDINRVGLAVTNYGFLGNNFVSRSPSFEFPLGSGYEHMARAGLWVGARAIGDLGVFTGVSAAIVDNAQGTSSAAETEFTPAGRALIERSRIANAPTYSRDAISDQDLDGVYSDRPARGPVGAQRERHEPLDLIVKQKTLAFSLQAADGFVVVRYTILNDGPPLADVWVALYAQLVSGDRDAYSTWPPSATSGPGSWYYKTYAEYDSTRRLYKERYCERAPYPDACNVPYAPPWAGIRLLATAPDTIATKQVGFHWWSYTPGDTTRDTDVERYALMSDPAIGDPTACVPGGQCSPIALLSVGPFAQLDPGDSIVVDFALVGGDDEAQLLANADFAQFASDIGYRLPSPPPSPRVHLEPRAGAIDVYWDDSPELVADETSPAPGGLDFEGYRVYLSSDRQRLTRVAQFDRASAPGDTTGFNTGFGAVRLDVPRVVDGIAYRYRLSIPALRDGFPYWGAVTSYDLGDVKVPSLESGIGQNKFMAVPAPAPGERRGVTVFPNPYRVEARWDQGRTARDHWLWFANLPLRATIRIYTLAGDLVMEHHFDGASYRGEGARGLYDPRQDLDTGAPTLSGGSWAWNLISREGQAIASGLYLWTVEESGSGNVERGKFLVVKSDREN